MQKVVILTIFLIRLYSLSASEEKHKPEESLEKIKSQLKEVQVALTATGSIDPCPKKTTNYSAEMCVMSVCGDTDQFVDYSHYTSEFAKKSGMWLKAPSDKYRNQFEEYFEKTLKYRKGNLSGLLGQIENGDLQPSPKTLFIHKLAYIMSFADYFSVEAKEDGYWVNGLDNYGNASNLTSKEQKWVVDSINELGVFKKISLYNIEPAKFIKNRYPHLSLDKGVKKAVEEMESSILAFEERHKELISLAPSMFSDIVDKQIIERVKNGDDLKVNELELIVDNISSIEALYPIFDNPQDYPIINNENFKLDRVIQNFSIKSQIENTLNDWGDEERINKFKEELVEECFYANASLDIMPTAKEVKNYEKRIPEYKGMVKSILGNLYSSATKTETDLVVDGVRFSLPLEKNKYRAKFSKEIEALKANDIVEASTYIMNKNKKDRHLLEVSNLIEGRDDSPFQEVLDTCKGFSAPLELSDATETLSGKISVSWQSVRFPSLGKGVALHEISHNIFSRLKKGNVSKESFDSFSATTSCLNDSHDELNPDLIATSSVKLNNAMIGTLKEGLYADEDYADMIAGFAYGRDEKNYACHWVSKEMRGKQLSEMVNPHEEDPHSSALFRLINMSLSKSGKLTKECEGYLAQEKSSLKKCF